MFKFVAFVCFLTLLTSRQTSSQVIEPLLTGGIQTQPSDYPWVVSITSNVATYHCLGVVINDMHVLTAATCVLSDTTPTLINPTWLTVVAGDIDLTIPTFRRVVRNVTHLFPHAQFQALSRGNNIAVIRVGERFPLPHNTIEPARLISRNLAPGENCYFAGWGQNAQIPAVVNQFQRVITLTSIAHAACAPLHGNHPLTNMICTGPVAAVPNSLCQGNMGGGLYCGATNNQYLAGIHSHGFACGQANVPGVFIDVFPYTAWINAQFTRTVRFPPGTPVAQTN